MHRNVLLALLALLTVSEALAAPIPISDFAATEAIGGRRRLFEHNVGQLDPRVSFVLRGPSYHAFVQPDSVVYTWFDRIDPDPEDPFGRPTWNRTGTVRMQLVGADPQAVVEGVGEAQHSVTHLRLGTESNLRPAQFERVAVRSVYEGIDVEYYLRGLEIEHDFIVAPGVDPAVIRVRFDGADSVELAPSGDLVLTVGERRFVQQAPFVYQGSRDDPEAIEASYRVDEEGLVAYQIRPYDSSRPLVIDPIGWTSHLGGSSVEIAADVAADVLGGGVVLLLSMSDDFPIDGTQNLINGGPEPMMVVLARVSQGFGRAPGADSTEFRIDALGNSINVRGLSLGRPCPASDGLTIPPLYASFTGSHEGGQGRLDAFVFTANLDEPGSGNLLNVGSPTNDQGFGTGFVQSCMDDFFGLLVAANTGELQGQVGALAGQHNGGLDAFLGLFEVPSSGPVTPLAASYFGTPENDFGRGFDATRNGQFGAAYQVGSSPNATQIVQPGLVNFASQGLSFAQPYSAVIAGRIDRLFVREGSFEASGRRPEGGGFGLSGPMDGSGPLETVKFGPDGSLPIGLVPTAEGASREALYAEIEAAFFAPDSNPPLFALQPWGSVADSGSPERWSTATEVFPDTDWFLIGNEANVVSERRRRQTPQRSVLQLGPGRTSAFDCRPGGAYLLAGEAVANVFTPIDGATVPEPLRGISPGPVDVFAVGGRLNADWVITVTGPASFRIEPVARDGIATGFVPGLAPQGQSAFAPSVPLPNDMLGAVAVLIDAAGVEHDLGQFFVNSNQMNFHVPPGAALGVARIEIRTAEGVLKVGETLITNVFPNAFTFGAGAGAGAAALTIVKADGTRTDTTTIAEPQPTVSDGDVLAVSQFATGTANAQSFRAICEGVVMQFLAAAPTPGFLGLEQVAFLLDFALLGGSGPQEVECFVEADGVASNSVKYGYTRVQ